MDFNNISFGFVGLGLMGGSMAKALKKNGAKVIYALDKNENTIKKALEDKIIDFESKSEKEIIEKVDVLVLGLYPEGEIEFLKRNIENFTKKILITDMSGLKKNLMEKIKEILPKHVEFISLHPMTGKEVNGYDNSSAFLFEESNIIIIEENSLYTSESLLFIKEIFKSFGTKKIILTSDIKHDKMIAYTSHLPHLLAVALCKDNSFGESVNFVGRSFKDVSRVANINEDLWTDLFLENKENVLESMDVFIENFKNLKSLIEHEDKNALRNSLKLSRLRKEEVNGK